MLWSNPQIYNKVDIYQVILGIKGQYLAAKVQDFREDYANSVWNSNQRILWSNSYIHNKVDVSLKE